MVGLYRSGCWHDGLGAVHGGVTGKQNWSKFPFPMKENIQIDPGIRSAKSRSLQRMGKTNLISREETEYFILNQIIANIHLHKLLPTT